jgi:hypothetical protein
MVYVYYKLENIFVPVAEADVLLYSLEQNCFIMVKIICCY